MERDARLKLLKLRQDIASESNRATEQNIEFRLDPNTGKKIKAQFDLQRKELRQQAQEEKRQAAIDFVDFDGGKKAKALIDAKYAVIRKRLAQEEKKAILDADKETGLARLEITKNTEELLLDIAKSNNALTEEQIAEEKIVVLVKFYNDKIKLLEDNIKKEKALGFTTIEDQKELDSFRAAGNADVIRAQDDLSKIRFANNQRQLTEQARHEQAMVDLSRTSRLKFNEIEGFRQSEDIERQIAFEEKKLEIIKASGEATEQEVIDQENAVAEIREKSVQQQKENNLQLVNDIIDGSQQVLSAEISAASTLIQIQADKYDKLSQLQEQRVEDAKKIAEDGNAELLEAEQKRLDDINKERERFVRNQQALSAIELVANATVAVAKAAAQGGVAAPFTIAATLIALAAGLAQARAVASQAAFYEGGLYEGEGFTGHGSPREVGSAVGPKPYTYHKQEFIFNHQTTSKYRDIFEGIHKGNINLHEWKQKAKMFDRYKYFESVGQAAMIMNVGSDGHDISELKGQMSQLILAVKSQAMSMTMDANGWEMHLKGFRDADDYVRNKLAKP